MLREHSVVQPTEWFQSTLVQGCLWRDTYSPWIRAECSLGRLSDSVVGCVGGELSKGKHVKLWKSIIRKIIREILDSKQSSQKGCVFALWGRKPQELRPMLEELSRLAGVPVKLTEGVQHTCYTCCTGNIHLHPSNVLHALVVEPRGWCSFQHG